MKIIVKAKLTNPWLALDYRRFLLSWLKSCLQNENPKQFDAFYGEEKTVHKNLTFYTALPVGTKFTSSRVELSSNEFEFTISTSDSILGIDLYNGALKTKKYPVVDSNEMCIERVLIGNTAPVKCSKILIQTNSPIIVRQHERGKKDQYFVCNDLKFQESLQRCLGYQLEYMGQNKDDAPMILPIKAKKVIVKAFGINIPGSIGTFLLQGKPEIINLFIQNGMGSRCSEGFGGITVLNEIEER